MELFIRKLIYLDLTKRNYVKILKQLRKLHWELPEVTPSWEDSVSGLLTFNIDSEALAQDIHQSLESTVQ